MRSLPTHRTTGRLASRLALLILSLGLILTSPACDETDQQVVTEIGTAVLAMSSPGLGSQFIKDPDRQMQVAVFNVTRAMLTLPDGTQVDLRADAKCTMVDTAVQTTTTRNRCRSGIVVGTTPEPGEALLDISFQMEVRRAEPVDLPPDEDFDGDTYLNGVDTCPLVPNPRQMVDKCSTVGLGGFFLGNADGDSTADEFDNCIWIPNNDQTNTMGANLAFGVDDLIGDACTEEIAVVEDNGSTILRFPDEIIAFESLRRQPTFVVVGIDHNDALDCDFAAGTCQLNRDAVRFCATTNPLIADLGCL